MEPGFSKLQYHVVLNLVPSHVNSKGYRYRYLTEANARVPLVLEKLIVVLVRQVCVVAQKVRATQNSAILTRAVLVCPDGKRDAAAIAASAYLRALLKLSPIAPVSRTI